MFRKVFTTAVALSLSAAALLAASKTYQVTGPVLAITGNTITVQKGSDKWEIEKDAATKIKGDLKVGSKVTIDYRMMATSVDVKEEKAAKPKPAAKKH